jgi:uncharacterized protein YbjT (DUF2867 family)
MHIAVTTPTGHVGSQVVAMLIRAGITPRVLVRDPNRLDSEIRARVDAVAVDQFDADSVAAATIGVDALFWVDPTTGSEEPLADYDLASIAVARAVRENQIDRVVFQSSVGAEKRYGAGEIDGLAATEIALDATDANVIHLRCGLFFSNLELQLDAIRSGALPVIVPLDLALPWVAPRDIAEVAVHRLLLTQWSGHLIQGVHGPVDLTWSQVAEIVTATTGHPLKVERIPDGAMRDILRDSGMTDGLVEAVIGMSTGLREGFVPEQPRTPQTTTPTTLACWAYDVLRPQLESSQPNVTP